MTLQQIEKKIASIVKIIERYDNNLLDLQQKYGTQELYLDRSSTCGCLPEEITPYNITYHTKDRLTIEYRVGKHAEKIDIYPARDEYGELYLYGADEFAEDISWNRNRIKSAERFYQSENPDQYLESDGDEDE